MNYGYARVSTLGQNLDEQIERLKEAGCNTIYSEHFTGTKTDRPQFNELINAIQIGDTLTITKLDRLARNTREALTVMDNLLKKDII